jgi:isopenicillin-N N-acyltransferase-like protein
MIRRVSSANLPAVNVQRSFDTYVWLFRDAASTPWDEVRRLSATWEKSIATHAPELLEQLAVWADALSGEVAIHGRPVDVVDFVALNARSEILASVWSTPSECTTLQYRDAAAPIVAQTWDWFGAQRDALVTLDVDAPAVGNVLTLTEAGMLAKIGINGAGLCVGLNSLSSATGPAIPSDDNGWVVPVHVMLRILLDRCRSVADVQATLSSIKTSAGANITVADASGATAMFETMPAAEPVAVAPRNDWWTIHTNHCVNVSTAALQGGLGGAFEESSDRYDRAAQLVDGASDAQDPLAFARGVLADTSNGYHAICQQPDPALDPTDRTETVVAVVLQTGEAGASMEIAPGRPSEVAFGEPLLVKSATSD